MYTRSVTFDELTAEEQLALAGLVRLMVRMDGQFTPDEVIAVSTLAKDIGATRFWLSCHSTSARASKCPVCASSAAARLSGGMRGTGSPLSSVASV